MIATRWKINDIRADMITLCYVLRSIRNGKLKVHVVGEVMFLVCSIGPVANKVCMVFATFRQLCQACYP